MFISKENKSICFENKENNEKCFDFYCGHPSIVYMLKVFKIIRNST